MKRLLFRIEVAFVGIVVAFGAASTLWYAGKLMMQAV